MGGRRTLAARRRLLRTQLDGTDVSNRRQRLLSGGLHAELRRLDQTADTLAGRLDGLRVQQRRRAEWMFLRPHGEPAGPG